MINMTGMIPAPINWEITLKPVGMSRKVKRIAPECVYLLTAADRDTATNEARRRASIEGFNNYAVTRVREVKEPA
jgi:hypothetical protein